MTTAAKTPVLDRFQDIFMPGGEIAAKGHLVGRDEQIEMSGYSLLARTHNLLLGEPGVAKSLVIDRMLAHVEGTEKFSVLMGKDMDPSAILGPPSVAGIKNGTYERVTDGMLPPAHIAFIDEIFKCNSLTLNSMLGIINERKFRNGRAMATAELVSAFGASNELPGFDREDLMAFRDRLTTTMIVEPVRAKDQRIQVMKGQIARASAGADTLTTITLDELRQAHAAVDAITVSDEVYEAVAKLIQMTEDGTNGGYTPSLRRVGQGIRLMQARAWAHGNAEVSTDDMMLLQHVFWLDPDHKDVAYRNVLEFANAFARQAQKIRDAFEPTLQELDRLRQAFADAGEGEPPDDALNDAFRVMKHLRSFEKQAKEAMNDGRKQGHDVSELDKLQGEIVEARGWVRKNLLGDEDGKADE